MKQASQAMRVFVTAETHNKIIEEKKRQGGKNIPFIVGELIDLGLEFKRIATSKK